MYVNNNNAASELLVTLPDRSAKPCSVLSSRPLPADIGVITKWDLAEQQSSATRSGRMLRSCVENFVDAGWVRARRDAGLLVSAQIPMQKRQ